MTAPGILAKLLLALIFCLGVATRTAVCYAQVALSEDKFASYAAQLPSQKSNISNEVFLLAYINSYSDGKVPLNERLSSNQLLIPAGWYVLVLEEASSGQITPESLAEVQKNFWSEHIGRYKALTAEGIKYAWLVTLTRDTYLTWELGSEFGLYRLPHVPAANELYESNSLSSLGMNVIVENISTQRVVRIRDRKELLRMIAEIKPKEAVFLSKLDELSPQAGTAKSLAVNNVGSTGVYTSEYQNLLSTVGYTGNPNDPGNNPNTWLYGSGSVPGVNRCSSLNPYWCSLGWSHWLNGMGQTVHIIDRRPLPVSGTPALPISGQGHIALLNKFPNSLWVDNVSFNSHPSGMGPGENQSHGTRVATIIGGDSSGINEQGVLVDPYAASDLALSRDGIASKATLAFTNVRYVQTAPTPIATVLANMEALHSGSEALIHNLSFSEASEFYTTIAAGTDTFIRNNERSVVAVALNNSQLRITSPGNCKNCLGVGTSGDLHPMPSSDGVPTVNFFTDETRVTRGIYSGSADNANSVGPTRDGRFKPDIVMPGRVLSGEWVEVGSALPYSDPSDSQTPYGGWSSYATAMVSGMAALVRQYFMYGYYYPLDPALNGMPNPALCPGASCEPSAALVKAVLVNSTRKLSECPPSPPYNCTSHMNWPSGGSPTQAQIWFYNNSQRGDLPGLDQGWGASNLNTLYFNDSQPGGGGSRLFIHDVSNSGSGASPLSQSAVNFEYNPSQNYTAQEFEFSIPSQCAGKEFRAALVWTDLPSGVNCAGNWGGSPYAESTASCLLNDLDLEIITPSGQIYRGNYFDRPAGYSLPGGFRDRLNNVELVRFLHSAQTGFGNYIVRIKAAALQPGSTQGYGLVVNSCGASGGGGSGTSVEVLGLGMTYGSTGIPVPGRLSYKSCDLGWTPLFGGSDLSVPSAPDAVSGSSSSEEIVFNAKMAYPSFAYPALYREVNSMPQVPLDPPLYAALSNGDNLDQLLDQLGAHGPYGGQVGLNTTLAPYLNSSGNILLPANQQIYIFEVGTSNPSSSAFDFQDIVLLVTQNSGEKVIQVLGLGLTYGSTGIPVPTRLDFKRCSPGWVPLFGDSNLVVGSPPAVIADGATKELTFLGRIAYPSFESPALQRQRDSTNPPNPLVPHVILGQNGDNIDELLISVGGHGPYSGQQGLSTILAPYLNAQNNLVLPPGVKIFMFEMGGGNPASSTFDFQDIVIKVTSNN